MQTTNLSTVQVKEQTKKRTRNPVNQLPIYWIWEAYVNKNKHVNIQGGRGYSAPNLVGLPSTTVT